MNGLITILEWPGKIKEPFGNPTGLEYEYNPAFALRRRGLFLHLTIHLITMDNQQNQSGSPMPGDDVRVQNAGNPTGSTGLGNDATVSGAGTGRKASSARSSAQSASNQGPTNQQDDSQRQGEGQQTNAQEGTLLDTALNSGKKWIEDSGVLDSVNQLPQSLKDLGTRALDRVNGLSTTQKVVGGAILAAGLGWLATRKGKSSDSSDSSAYNYGRQRDAGSYGRRNYGYQAPDASTSRRPAAGTSSRSDSGSAYGNSGSRYGSSGSYDANASSAGNTGIHSGSGRDDSGAAYGSASARTDHGSQSSSTDSRAQNSDYRSIE
ncbi:hypothetical protein GCM10022409_24840 [Hymenobacter glaciei]|uniref:Uncharacterized protein n=2 Tax=Hymenobacter glaciei TaxID=877209 RepID=A0ABP7U9H4_9BACT